MPSVFDWYAMRKPAGDQAGKMAENSGVSVVDFYSLFKTRPELFADESHFTAEGHRSAAELLAQRLRPHLRGAAGD